MNTIPTNDKQPSARRDRGFTLVELLIVIVILGILATVTVFAVNGITSDAKDSTCETEQKTLETAAAAYLTLNGTYAGTDLEADLVADDYLDAVSADWDISTTGAVTATDGGDCAPAVTTP